VARRRHDEEAGHRIEVAGLTRVHRCRVPDKDLVMCRMRGREPRGVRLRERAIRELLGHHVTVWGVVGVGDSCETCPDPT